MNPEIVGLGVLVFGFLGIIFISGCIQQDVVARLISIEGGSFVDAAGYYEGTLKLKEIKTDKEYSIFVCTKDWSWVELNSCYNFNLSEIENNIESHKYSAELGGCYVGKLEKVNC